MEGVHCLWFIVAVARALGSFAPRGKVEMSLKEHWEAVYEKKKPAEVSWSRANAVVEPAE